MNTEAQERDLMTEQRRHQEHINESMLNRSEDEVAHPTPENDQEHEQARGLTTEGRHQVEHIKEAMLNRAENQ
ncbi:MAG: hypothetical protein KME06_07035 [Kastovskya adunca ATA6-11-RM4]|jgi:hypothetical protein|nr:hypothetical protein [Kastovskya adunca ATA6-11-RM4]